MSCPVCGLSGECRHVAYLPSCAVYRCVNCSALFSDPPPSDKELSEAYNNFNAGELSRNEFDLYRLHAANMLRDLIGSGASRRFLDYGCGGGHFVAAAGDLGFQAVGIDLDNVSVKAGVSRGLDIRQAMPGSCDSLAPHEVFDVILMFHVLEHMAAPRQMVASLLNHLRPGGTVVIGVPDQNSVPSRIKRLLRWLGVKRTSYGFVQPPVHVIGFTKHSVRAIGENLGLQCLAVRNDDATDPDTFPVGRKYWSGMPIHRAIYSFGAMLGSGGHLLATFRSG